LIYYWLAIDSQMGWSHCRYQLPPIQRWGLAISYWPH
jgi:hypothetical protein